MVVVVVVVAGGKVSSFLQHGRCILYIDLSLKWFVTAAMYVQLQPLRFIKECLVPVNIMGPPRFNMICLMLFYIMINCATLSLIVSGHVASSF